MESIYSNKVTFLLSIILFFSLNISEALGTVLYMALLLLLLIVSSRQGGSIFRFTANNFFVLWGVFIVICCMSIIWAKDKSLSIEAATSLVRLWVVFQVIFYTQRSLSMKSLFDVILYGSLILFSYEIMTVGFSKFVAMAVVGERLGDEIINSNAIGLLASISSVICFSRFIYQKKWLVIVLGLLALSIVFISGSRKAMVVFLIGCFLVYILKNVNRGGIRFWLRIITTALVFVFVIYILLNSFVFFINEDRFLSLSAFITGSDDLIHSDYMRKELISTGWKSFLENPALGIGIDNGKILASRAVGHFYYLHNNYIELLADVGLIGTLSFYLIYFVFFKKMLPCYSVWDEYSKLAVTLLIMFLIADWGRVSYYYKDVLFVIMVCYKVMYDTKKRSKSIIVHKNGYRHIKITR